ncbi:MAG: beta-galactosidase [Oscillospiraceae bacterium]|jgi:beta-galactosidase|nr:beta-galactosidase [Oscillospiraceae bacterium]
MQNGIVPYMLHGCDYAPDLWLDRQDILAEDIDYMKRAGINCVTLGLSAWAALEPEEGAYDFGWLGDVIDNLHRNGIRFILATPGGAGPVWMAERYPEALCADLSRGKTGGRRGYCRASPVYREKIYALNQKLARAFGSHPAAVMWRLSGEDAGQCFCPLCRAAFRRWLEARYKDVGAVNEAWWTRAWGPVYTGWDQIDPPFRHGRRVAQGLRLDWMRFVTDRAADFMAWEKKAVRGGGSVLPVTASFTRVYDGLACGRFRGVLDAVSWGGAPFRQDGQENDADMAARAAAAHDLMRSILPEKPFLLTGSTPGAADRAPVSNVRRPGLNMLFSMQAVAHGSDSVQYSRWRKDRGGNETFSGAVVSHDRRTDTRVFRDVAGVGRRLAGLDTVTGSVRQAQAAVIYDRENDWAIRYSGGAWDVDSLYRETVLKHHRALWQLGIGCDMPDMEDDLSRYTLAAAPMLYMQRAGIAGKLRRFVENGGVLVGTCFSGLVDENGLCFLSDAPNGLTDVFGLRAEECGNLRGGERNHILWRDRCHAVLEIIELIRLEGAKALAVYENDFYRGEAALCEHTFGKGKAYYIAGGAEQYLLNELYAGIAAELPLERALDAELPEGVTAQTRHKEGVTFIIAQNYNQNYARIPLNTPVRDLETGVEVTVLELVPYGVRFLTRVPAE